MSPEPTIDEAFENMAGLLAEIPYANFLGIELEKKGLEVSTVLKPQDHLVGNKDLPAIHGGVVGAFLEMTAVMGLVWQTKSLVLPKPININIAYLRSARLVETYGRAEITKQGRRVAHVHVESWQDDHTRPNACLDCHFLMQDE